MREGKYKDRKCKIELREDGSRRVAYKCSGENPVQGSQAIGMSPKEQIQRIHKGLAPSNVVDPKKLAYGDFTDGADYQTHLNRVKEAQESFNALPLEVRQRVQTPKGYIDFLSNPENKEEMYKFGMLNEKQSQLVAEQIAKREKEAKDKIRKEIEEENKAKA